MVCCLILITKHIIILSELKIFLLIVLSTLCYDVDYVFLFVLFLCFFFLFFLWLLPGPSGKAVRQYFPYVSSESDLQRYKAIIRQNPNNDTRASSSLSNVPSDSNKIKVNFTNFNKFKFNYCTPKDHLTLLQKPTKCLNFNKYFKFV